MNYKQTIEYLFSAMPSFQNVGSEGYKPGLERMVAFCGELGDPHLSYPVIHIAGTNGKGSTSHMLASSLQAAGYRVGLFTSPHLRDFRERVRVDGEVISQTRVVEFVAQYRNAMERLQLSFFEMTAALALSHFADERVDVAVIETGLGGRLDATNIVSSQLSIITNIGIDHTQYLGDTRAKIAAEKAGIIKESGVVIVGERGERGEGGERGEEGEPSCSEIFESKARQMGAQLIFAEDRYSVEAVVQGVDYQQITLCDSSDSSVRSYRLDLMGGYQRKNLITVITAIEQINSSRILRHPIGEEALEQGLRSVAASTSLLGRWQRLSSSPLTICDTGHNLHGLCEVTAQIKRQSYRKLYCVLGFARDKDLEAILPLFPRDAHFIFTRPAVERAFEASYLSGVARDIGLSCEVVEGVEQALRHARSLAEPDDMIFVGGSTFVVAELSELMPAQS